MEQWEHMFVMSQVSPDGAGRLHAVTADRGVSELADSASPRQVLEALNQLGRQGWQLVSTDLGPVGTGGHSAGFYFLKRRADPS